MNRTCNLAICFYAALSMAVLGIMGFLSPDGKLQADGSILLKPGEMLTIQFELRDGKLVNPKAVPRQVPTAPNTLYFYLSEDKLTISTGLPKGEFSMKCTYSSGNNPKPLVIARIKGTHSLRKPVKSLTLSDFVFTPE